jgi:hypothetical protein
MEAGKLAKSTPQAFELSLRIRHPSMDPADISRALKIQAEHSFRTGEPRRSSSGVATASVYAESYWLGLLPPPSPPVDISFPGNRRSQLAQEHLVASTQTLSWALSLSAVRFLSPHADLLRRIRSEGGQVSLLVSISDDESCSFIVPPETSQFFGNLGVTIEVELSAE